MWSMVNTNTLNLACWLPPLDSSKSRLVWRNRLPPWPPSNVASSLGHSGPASACPPSTILWERFERSQWQISLLHATSPTKNSWENTNFWRINWPLFRSFQSAQLPPRACKKRTGNALGMLLTLLLWMHRLWFLENTGTKICGASLPLD